MSTVRENLPVIENDIQVKTGDPVSINDIIFTNNFQYLIELRINVLYKLSKWNFNVLFTKKSDDYEKKSIFYNFSSIEHDSNYAYNHTNFKEKVLDITHKLMFMSDSLSCSYNHLTPYNEQNIYINKMINQETDKIPTNNTDYIGYITNSCDYKSIIKMLNLMTTNLIIIGYCYLNNILNTYIFNPELLNQHREELEKTKPDILLVEILKSKYLSEDNKCDIIEIIDGINEIIQRKRILNTSVISFDI